MMAVPVSVGRLVAIAGRSTPFVSPSTKNDATMLAPVFPGLTTALASPLLTNSVATQIEESLFFRATVAGDSCISTTCEACRLERRGAGQTRRGGSTGGAGSWT